MHASISPSDTGTLLRQLQAATSLKEAYRCRNLLLKNHLGLVSGVVRIATAGRPWLPHDDAFQEACCALLQVVVSASPDRAGEFPAFARTAMLHRVRGFFAAYESPTMKGRTPRRLGRIRSFIATQGEPPERCPDATIAAGTALSSTAVRRLRPWISQCPLEDAADEPSAEFVGTAQSAERGDDVRQLRALVATLPERERWIVTRLWVDDREPESVLQIAGKLGVSRQYALRCYRRALRRLHAGWRE